MKVNLENSCLFNHKQNKIGAAHFEMIISIVFFTGFVFFLFMIINPQDTSALPNSITLGLYDSFIEEVHTNLSSIFLKANYTGIDTCFSIQLSPNIFVYNITNGNSHVEKLNGENINSSIVGNDLNIENNDTFFRILISPEFESGSISGCDNFSNYEFGSIIERQVISYSALENITNKYYNDYESLKVDLKVPSIFDFSIVAENLSNIAMEPVSGIPSSVEIMAQDYIYEVLKKDGSIINERFTLKTW